MFVRQYESVIENESSSDEEVFKFQRKLNNIIASNSSSENENSYESEDFEELLENLSTEEENEQNDTVGLFDNIQWMQFTGKQKSFEFTGNSGLLVKLPASITAGQVLSLFLNEQVIDLIVVETNRYAEKKFGQNTNSEYLQDNRWEPTNSEEIKIFLGLLLWMELVQVPLNEYWSTNPIYNFPFPRSKMSRKRFKLLLSNLHFSNNEAIQQNNRLGKVLLLLQILTDNYQQIFLPGPEIVVDETIVPWRGRLLFRQYIPTKSYKHGMKLFKLCSTEGYTWSIKIYAGRDICGINQTCSIIPENVCIELINKLLNEGRTLYIDNFYTSYELAIKLLNFKTYVVGTVRHNRNFMPKDVMFHQLQRGEIISREDDNGIVVLKWKNIRDVSILSSKHAPVMVPISDSSILSSRRPPKTKPLAVIAYDTVRSGIDRNHQMVSYATTIRKSIKWYQKLAIHFLIGITVINAHIVYQKATNQKIKIRKFRELIVQEWLESENAKPHIIEKAFHQLQVRKNPQGKSIRRMCVRCYAKQRQTQQRQEVRKNLQKTITYCPECPRSPQLCFLCFNEFHHNQ
ncbi:PREDICTED: piggyBac transposable element-derived protein 4-like [Polistes dominula]|uniref:PiggyBac transposable element-derived protein 4-like n=1 Tax=Polistes dominula TaxID=743375 RepID=A0ABM1J0G1_POLDO|nr:PREDICTED: piggyBac transposable element-derived protein 4-like [Polistes dominula]